MIVAEETIKRGGFFAIEWPKRCKYWYDPEVCRFLKKHKVYTSHTLPANTYDLSRVTLKELQGDFFLFENVVRFDGLIPYLQVKNIFLALKLLLFGVLGLKMAKMGTT